MEHEVPVIALVDDLVRQAIASRASDIHVEATSSGLRVRWRIDGVLYDKDTIDSAIMSEVVSRIKVLAHIDIAERRVPHDGKFKVTIDGNEIDLRVSTFPSIHGEKVVIRILDRARHMLTLDNLGLDVRMSESFKKLITRSSGFFLASGPTGSGKTTTLYAALSYLNCREKNIVTLEDPVEYSIEGITQAQIRPEAGFTFERGLRSLLRQDPNIVMIGEIRDRQTAQVSIEAALTGHVVLSTIHTNDAPTVIMRLIDMGIEPFLVNAAVTGVLAQRLARTICPSCRVSAIPTPEERTLLKAFGADDTNELYRAFGCPQCLNLGYKGQIGIFELLTMTEGLRSLVMRRPHLDAIMQRVHTDGMKTLINDGVKKVQAGIITLEELVRAVL